MSSTPEPPAADPDPAAAAPRRKAVVIGVLVAVLVLAIAAAGIIGWRAASGDESPDAHTSRGPVSSGPSQSPAATDQQAATDPRLARFYDQTLRWRDCGRTKCAVLTVPLDYEHPDGKTIGLAVLKVPALDPKGKVGALVVNPGGPGGSGVSYAAAGSLQFGTPLSRAFDIVGFDPRGVGQSDPLECVDTKQLDALVAFDPDPDDRAERTEMDRLIHGFGQGCLDHSGDLARHMSTKEAARDMDILRSALGERRLDYLGASYGTFLGATYADLFPEHVGRFVLDGAIDPALSNEQLSLAQAHGFETALRAYVKDCVDRGGCFLGRTVTEGISRIQALLAQVEQQPLPTGTSRDLTEGLAMLGIWMPLYVREYWPTLTDALRMAIDDGDGRGLLEMADQYTSRGPNRYLDNSIEALYAVNCLDHADYISSSEVPGHVKRFEEVSPTFGRAFAYSLSTCASWPVKSGNRTIALHAKGAPPIVVIGTTRDPATPYAWAKGLADELDSGRLISRDGDGHTGFNQGNRCVDSAVERYLVRGTVPEDGLSC